MSLRDAFLRALADNEDDATTRLVYADWLDEQGEHEEADRQRKWPGAKEWLLRFCKENSGYEEVSYEGLIELGRRVVEEESAQERIYLHDGGGYHALKTHGEEFWKNWSVVTGIALPPSFATKGFHTRYVPGRPGCEECGEDVLLFGLPEPEPSDPEPGWSDPGPPPHEPSSPELSQEATDGEVNDDDRADPYGDEFYEERGW